MEMITNKVIASTIIAQIKNGDKWFLPAIGATNFIALPESKEYAGGLMFKCNGIKHKAFVKIELKWIDTYVISFIKKNGELIKLVEDVYCDELIRILDYIEGK